ncbi:hypothetical protein [Paenibacillus tyrfis]|uniref:Copper amine oxidase-like N-terminal domain-containing protein n=1 Tax=Paenibacillus tyrfis TaxID=1501230 RepID=A0A081P818_9BACL|nr:hypothetical protein [Paenibacillus tyrfis]KEQ26841.1 hypothetical protein ET33_29270 [Paenibacillus tyrfis]
MKMVLLRILLLVTISMGLYSTSAKAQDTSISVQLPNYKISVSGVTIDNENSLYPFLNYNNVTYLPLTWHYKQSLCIDTNWNNKSEYMLRRDCEYPKSLVQDLAGQNNMGSRYEVTIPAISVRVNEKVIDNTKEEYPLFVFRDITYMPVNYQYAIESLQLEVVWDENRGLGIGQTENIKLPGNENNNITGKIKGKVTWQPKTSDIRQSDEGSKVFIIPVNFNKKSLNSSEAFHFAISGEVPKDSGLFVTDVNKDGEYEAEIPPGEYVMVISSNHANRKFNTPIDERATQLLEPLVPDYVFFCTSYLDMNLHDVKVLEVQDNQTSERNVHFVSVK